MKRTFQHGERRRWSIERRDEAVTVFWGVEGGKEQSRTTVHSNEWSARQAAEQLVNDKMEAGYREITRYGQLPVLERTGQLLEAALVDDPDDLAGHMAYADWLSEQADPALQARGEYIRVQLALEGPVKGNQKRKLTLRERELRAEHEHEWLGAAFAPAFLLARDACHVSDNTCTVSEGKYRRGWLDEVKLATLTEPFARLMRDAPALRLLRALDVQGMSTRRQPLTALAGATTLGNVRRFTLAGYFPKMDVTPVVATFPRLEELNVTSLNLNLGKSLSLDSLTNLRVLSLTGWTELPVADLVSNPALSQLESLTLVSGASRALRREDVRQLLRATNWPALGELAIQSCALGDELVEEVIESGILRQLRRLDLSRGAITDDGARQLGACPDLSNLEELNVTYNRLTRRGATALKNKGPNIINRYQQSAMPDGTYTPLRSQWNL